MKSLGYKILFVLILAGLVFVACQRNKKINGSGALDKVESKGQSLIDQGYSRVTVTNDHTSDGCDYLLIAKAMGDTEILQPVVLRDDCKQDGKVIYIKFRPSRAPQTGNCTMGSLISIDDVKFE